MGAGMSGGKVWVYDAEREFPDKLNSEMVSIQTLAEWEENESDELHEIISEHVRRTGSRIGRELLENWQKSRHQFLKVQPHSVEIESLSDYQGEETEEMSQRLRRRIATGQRYGYLM